MAVTLPLTLKASVLQPSEEGIQLLVEYRLNGAAQGGGQAILNRIATFFTGKEPQLADSRSVCHGVNRLAVPAASWVVLCTRR